MGHFSSAEPATRPRLPLVVYVLTAGTFLMGTSEFVVAGLLTEMADEFGISVARAGLSITVFAVGMIIGAPIIALLTMRMQRRLVLIAALAVFAVGHVVAAVAATYDVVLLARFVTALATGAFWAVGSVTAAASVGAADTSRALGLVLGGGKLAVVLGVPLGALTGQVIGWRGTFWGLAVLAVIAAAVVAVVVPADASDRPRPSVRRELRALRNVRLWLTLATCTLINAGVMSIYSYVATLITGRADMPVSTVPFALMLFGIGAVIGSVTAGRLGDRHPFPTALTLMAATMLTALGILTLGDHPAVLLTLFGMLGLVGLSANPIMVSLAIRYSMDSVVLAGALPTSFFNLGTAIGTSLTAAVLGSAVGASAPALVATIAGVLVFIPLGLLAADARRARRADMAA